MSDTIRATITDYLARFSAADRAGWLALFTDDATVEDPVGSPVRHGKDEIGAFFDQSHGSAEAIALLADGPAIVVGQQASFRFTVRVTLGGTDFALPAIDVMTFSEDGHITSQRAFVDYQMMAPVEA